MNNNIENGDYCPHCEHYTLQDVGAYLRCSNCGAEYDYEDIYDNDDEYDRDDVHPSTSYEEMDYIAKHEEAYSDATNIWDWHFEENDDEMAIFCYEQLLKKHKQEFQNQNEIFLLLGLSYAYYDYKSRYWTHTKPKYNNIQDYTEDATAIIKDLIGEEEYIDENLLDEYRNMNITDATPDGFVIDNSHSYQFNELKNSYPFSYHSMNGLVIGNASKAHYMSKKFKDQNIDEYIHGRIFLANPEYQNANIFSVWSRKTFKDYPIVTNERLKLIFEELKDKFTNLRNWNTIYAENDNHWTMMDIDKRIYQEKKENTKTSSRKKFGTLLPVQYHALRYPYENTQKNINDLIEKTIQYNFDKFLTEEGIHIKKQNKGKFNALKKQTGKITEELTHSKNSLTRKRAIFAQNAKKMES